MTYIQPVLLSGGSGSRLWPVSRKSYPKQFSKLIGTESLFQRSAKRLTSSQLLKFTNHLTVTNSDFRFVVCEQLQEIGIDPGQIVIEPDGKNTGPAVLAASLFAHSKNPNAVLLVAPCDHLITEKIAFHEAILKLLMCLTHQNKLAQFSFLISFI